MIAAKLVACVMAALLSSAPPAAQDSPTLQETYNWLVAQMPHLSVTAGDEYVSKPEMWWKDCEVQFFEYTDGGSSRLSREAYERARRTRGFRMVSFNLGDLNISSIRKGGILVEVSTAGSKHIGYSDRLEWVNTDGSIDPPIRNDRGVATTVAFQTGDVKLQDRLVRALGHAIRLCGGSATPELFSEPAAEPKPPPSPQSTLARERSEPKPSTSTPAKRRTAKPSLSIRIAPSETGYVNVRKSADIKSPIVGRVRPGESYLASARNSGWYRIDAKGGWVNERYVIEK